MNDLRSDPPPAGDRKGRGQEGRRAHAVLRSGRRTPTRPQIKQAVEKLFKVKVEEVRTANFEGKLRRRGRFSGYRPDWKKAYVQAEGRAEDAGVRGDLEERPIMPIKTLSDPTRRRGASRPSVSREDITKQTPEKSLVEPARSAPAAATAPAASRRGSSAAAHKQAYRVIDFKRDKTGIPARGGGHRVRSEPLGAHRAAELRGRREALHPRSPMGLKVGRKVMSGPEADILVGNALPLKNIPAGTMVHNIELKPGKGAQMARSAGAQAQLVSQRRRLRAAEAAFGRNPPRAGRLHGDDRAGGQSGSRERFARQGGAHALAGQAAAQPRRLDEPGGPPARRRRGQDLGRPSSGDALGPADARLQDAQQQADRQVDRHAGKSEEDGRGQAWAVQLSKGPFVDDAPGRQGGGA